MSTWRNRAHLATASLCAAAAVLAPAAVRGEGQAASARAAASPVIEGLEVNADAGVATGSTLGVTMRGSPRGHASVLLPGDPAPVALHETDPGVYVASYTVRATERIDPDGTIRASVASGPRVTIARFRFPPSFRGTHAAMVKPVVPIAAEVKPVVPIAPAPAHAPAAAQSTAILGAAASTPAPLVLQVLSPATRALVTPDSGVQIEGRTAPNALVRTRIDAVPPAVPGRASVAQLVMEETVQADAEGRFHVDLGPQRAVPGTRFEIGLRAMHGQQSTPEQRLVAVQGQG